MLVCRGNLSGQVMHERDREVARAPRFRGDGFDIMEIRPRRRADRESCRGGDDIERRFRFRQARFDVEHRLQPRAIGEAPCDVAVFLVEMAVCRV
jgi:hypothetical protein